MIKIKQKQLNDFWLSCGPLGERSTNWLPNIALWWWFGTIWPKYQNTKIIKRKILQTYLQGWRQTYFRTGVIIIMPIHVIIIVLFISLCWTVHNTAAAGIRKSYYLVHRLWSEAELMYRRPAQCTRRRRRYLLFRMRFSLSSVVVKNQSRPSRPMHFFLTFLTSPSLSLPRIRKKNKI